MSIQIGSYYQLNKLKLKCVKKHGQVFTFHRINENGIVMQKQYASGLMLHSETYIICRQLHSLKPINLQQTELF